MKKRSAKIILTGTILAMLMGYSEVGLAEVNVNIGIGVPLPSKGSKWQFSANLARWNICYLDGRKPRDSGFWDSSADSGKA